MEAIVLAGGFGTRLSTVVSDVPKPMAPINGRPFLEYLLDDLNEKEINRVILAVGYKKEIIKSHFKEKYKSIDIVYSDEDIPLGTGGAIKKALTLAKDEDIFIINGDTFFDVDLKEMYQFHKKNNSKLTLAIKEMEKFDRYGSLILEGYKIIKFEEKKYIDKGYINGGIYLINKEVLNEEEKESFSFEKEILENKKFMLEKYGYKSEGYFIDIGVPEDYYRFCLNKKKKKIGIIIPTYNRAHLLEKVIPTYVNQKGENFELREIIIVDDYSSDNTEEVVEKLKAKYEIIEYYRLSKNSKQQIAKNTGIELLNKDVELVYFGDDDAILIPGSIEYLVETLEKYEADLVGARALWAKTLEEIIDYKKIIRKIKNNENEEIVNFEKDIFNFSNIYQEPKIVPVTHSYFLIKKSAIGSTRFSSIYRGNSYREETDFILEINKKGKKIMYDSRAVGINYPRIIATGGSHKRGVIGKYLWYYFWVIKNNNIFLDKNYNYLKNKNYIKSKKNILKIKFVYILGKRVLKMRKDMYKDKFRKFKIIHK